MRIEIETNGTANGTYVTINGDKYNDLRSFCFLIKEQHDKAKLQMRRAVDGGPDAVTNLYGNEIPRYDEDISHMPRQSVQTKPGG